jgi:hypothetical protein
MRRNTVFKLYLLDPRIYIGKFIYGIIDNRIENSLDMIGDEEKFISYRWFNIIKDKEKGFEIEKEAASVATHNHVHFGESKELFAWYYSMRYIYLMLKYIL